MVGQQLLCRGLHLLLLAGLHWLLMHLSTPAAPVICNLILVMTITRMWYPDTWLHAGLRHNQHR